MKKPMLNAESQFWEKIQIIQTRSRRRNKLSEKEADELREYLQVRKIHKTLDSVRKTILRQRKEESCQRTT
jgi:hypothetical protein